MGTKLSKIIRMHIQLNGEASEQQMKHRLQAQEQRFQNGCEDMRRNESKRDRQHTHGVMEQVGWACESHSSVYVIKIGVSLVNSFQMCRQMTIHEAHYPIIHSQSQPYSSLHQILVMSKEISQTSITKRKIIPYYQLHDLIHMQPLQRQGLQHDSSNSFLPYKQLSILDFMNDMFK